MNNNYKKNEASTPPQTTVQRAGEAWLKHIEQFPKLKDWFSSLPEVTALWLSQQIDIFANQYPPSTPPIQQVEAVGLLEWINKSKYQPLEGKWWNSVVGDPAITTTELYTIYKQSKMK